jgi:hypothetical protein
VRVRPTTAWARWQAANGSNGRCDTRAGVEYCGSPGIRPARLEEAAMHLRIPDTPEGEPRPQQAGHRHDLYARSHRALRLCLADTMVRLGRLDIADSAELDATLLQLHEVLGACRSHIDRENRYLHAAVEARWPGRSAPLAAEHAGQVAELASLRADADALRAAPEGTRALRLYRSFARLVAEKLRHMHSEETMNNEALWSAYSDDEIQAIEWRMVEGLDRRDGATLMRWMNAALPPAERSTWFAELQQRVVPQALAEQMEALRERLDVPTWHQLQQALRQTDVSARHDAVRECPGPQIDDPR